jgi:hypothetical protein
MRTTTQIIALLAAALPLALTACNGTDSNGGATSGCTSAAVTNPQQPMACMGTNIVAGAANNYAFSSTMRLPPQTVKSMSNLKFDWGGVTKDFLGHTIGGTNTIDTMSLLVIWLPLTEVEFKLNKDTLSQQDVYQVPPPSWPAPGMSAGATTSAMLYDFTANGIAVTPDQFNAATDPAMFGKDMFTFMAAAANGLTIGEGFRMLQTFHVDASSSNTTVSLSNTSTQLTCQVSLRNLTITGVTAGTPALTMSWQQLVAQGGMNALGNPFEDNYITSAVVGHFTETPEELEKKFLDLDLIATKYYRADIIQNGMLDFTALRTDGGEAFPGVDNTGTWMVGLICGNCQNPAPWYMTILKPCT